MTTIQYPMSSKSIMSDLTLDYRVSCPFSVWKTSSPKGNDAHLRAIIQREKKMETSIFRRLRAANSVVRGLIWPNFELIQALMYVIITCKYEKDPIKNNREKGATPFFKL